MNSYRLRKFGTMLYYHGSSGGRARTSKTGRFYHRRCDLTRSTQEVTDFNPSDWELQTHHVIHHRSEHLDGTSSGMEMPDDVDLERARISLRKAYPQGVTP